MTDNEILQMRAEGYTYQQIADKCGVSRQAIHQRVQSKEYKRPYYDQDITFCSKRNCKNTKCRRNSCHIDWSVKPYHSFADFEDTRNCPQKWIESEVKMK